MSPVLIDAKGLFKLGFILSIAAAAIFSGGFIFGYQKAQGYHFAGATTEPLVLPETTARPLSAFEPVTPKEPASGENIDVDQPAEPIVTAVDNETASGDRVSAALSQEQAESDRQIQASEKSPQTTVVASAGTDSIPAQSDETGHSAQSNSGFPADFSRIKYTIQVGMYGRLQNARNMADKLREQSFHAYVYDYLNSKQERRYTVRFGFFETRKSGIAALEQYRSETSGDGYLVRFSAEGASGLAVSDQLQKPVPALQRKSLTSQDAAS
jgi:cell division septation protein DedD